MNEHPIFEAIRTKDYKFMEEYFLSGQELALKDKEGKSLFSLVYFSDNRKIMRLFLSHPKIPPIFKAAYNHNYKVIADFQKRGGDFHLDISEVILPKDSEEFPMKFLLGALVFVKGFSKIMKTLAHLATDKPGIKFDKIIKKFIEANYDFKSYYEAREKYKATGFLNRSLEELKYRERLVETYSNLKSTRSYKDAPSRPFFTVTTAGFLKVMVVLLDTLPSLEVQDNQSGETPLLCAIHSNMFYAAKYLVLCGADLHKQVQINRAGMYKADISPLRLACCLNNLKIVKCLVESGANINERYENSLTPLFTLGKFETADSVDVVEYLLSRKELKPELLTDKKMDALSYSIMNKAYKTAIKMIKSGRFDLNVRETLTGEGFTYFHSAICVNSPLVFRALLEYGADYNIPTLKDGHTPFLLAAKTGCEEIVKMLVLEKKVDVNQRSEKNRNGTAFLHAAGGGHTNIVRFLFENKASSTTTDSRGDSALLYAAGAKNLETLAELLHPKYGLDINAISKDGIDALFTATSLNLHQNVQLLLKNKADSSHKFKDLTPLLAAKNLGRTESYKILLASFLNQTVDKVSEGDIKDKRELKKLIYNTLLKSDAKIDKDYTISISFHHFLEKTPKNKQLEVVFTEVKLGEIIKAILTAPKPEITEENFKKKIWESSEAYLEFQKDTDYQKNMALRAELRNQLANLEMRFSRMTTQYPGLQHNVKKLIKQQEAYLKDCIKWDEVSKEKTKQAQESAKNSLKRDRTKSKSFLEGLEFNQKRILEAKALKEDIACFLVSEQDIISSFYEDFEASFLQIEEWCNEFNFIESKKAIAKLEEHLKAYDNLVSRTSLFGTDLESRHEALLDKFKKDEKEKCRDRRDQDKATSRQFSETKAQEEEAKRALEEVELEKRRLQQLDKDNLARRLRFKEKRLAYIAEKEARQKTEIEAKQKAELEMKFKSEGDLSDNPLSLFRTVTSPRAYGSELLLFSPKSKQRSPLLLTLDLKGGIADELEQQDLRINVKKEIDILEECVKACMEMKTEILKDIKLQRHALLGTLARCMEYLKNIKQDEAFSAVQARKLRNYLFKGKRFLMKKEKDIKAEMELNHNIIDMVNEIIFCLREKDPDLSKIKSKLYQELQKAAEDLWIPAGVYPESSRGTGMTPGMEKPTLFACKKGIRRANETLDNYKKYKNDKNEILIECAEKYQLAARGTFAMWIRDYYSKYYRHSPDYKETLDLYIEEGNKIRHNDKSPSCQPSGL